MVWHLVFEFAENGAVILIPFYRGTGKNPKTFPLHFCSFLRKSRVVAWKQGHCAEKASAQLFRIADFGFFKFSFSIRIPQSTIRNFVRRAHRAPGRAPLHRTNPVLGKRMACPPGPKHERCLMVFSRKALASRPGKAQKSILLTTTRRKAKGRKL